MKKMMIEIEPEQIDVIVCDELSDVIEAFEEDLRRYENDERVIPIFDPDPVKDVLAIEEHISAFKLVKSYYSVPEL